MKRVLVVFALSLGIAGSVYAHSGGTDEDGCHTNHETGDYHCHNLKDLGAELIEEIRASRVSSYKVVVADYE